MKWLSQVIVRIAFLLLILATPSSVTQAAGTTFNKNNFNHSLDINNKYNPLVAGTTYIYDGTADRKSTHETFVVTDQVKTILGVDTRVIHDTVYQSGKLVEDTYDWYAQDDAGNVWYFGEDSTEFRNGKVISHEGSWEAGVGGASPGIVMEAHPKVGDTYQQEFAPGVAEDTATVLSLDASICVPYGCFSNVLKTKEFSPLEPGVVENKYYAAGVGEIKSILVQGGSEESHLTSIVMK